MFTPVHSDTDDADDYNRVIGIAQLRVFSCAKNVYNMQVLHRNLTSQTGCHGRSNESIDKKTSHINLSINAIEV